MTTKIKSTSLFAQVGNTFHILTLAATFAFAYRVVRHLDEFDPSWKKEGFCVANRDVPYMNSHDMCLYVDVLASILLFGVYHMLQSGQSEWVNTEMKMNIPGIIGHGLGHGAIGRAMRLGTFDGSNSWQTGYEGLMAMESNWDRITTQIPFVIFWLALLKGTLPNGSNAFIAALSVAVMLVQAHVPQVFGFTFVQTVLMVVYGINQLLQPADVKGFAYAMYPAVVGLPVVLVGWMESTQCTSFVKDKLYGHLVYDASIPLLMLVWYLMCHVHHNWTVSSGKVKAA